MARITIDTGTAGNTATGDSIRSAFAKTNSNFEELFVAVADSGLGGMFTTPFTNGDIKIQANGTGIIEIDRLSINNTTISSLDTNADITLTANGTGGIVLAGPVTATRITTNNITSNGSNADLTLTANGTGNIVLGTSVSMSSTLAVTGQTTLGTLQLDGDVGFHGTTPVAQQSAISYTSDGSTKNDVAIDTILSVLRNYGLIAS